MTDPAADATDATDETPNDHQHDADFAFGRVAAQQVRVWRRIALCALFGALLYTIVVSSAAIAGALWVAHFVDRSDTNAATATCRSVLSAEYDDQQSKFLDAADLRLTDARTAARRNMRVIVRARERVRSGICPAVTLEPVPIPGE